MTNKATVTTTIKTNSTLFISDLHLQEERPDITLAFLSFLQQQASQAQALYILGDFFNVWIGDDNHTELNQLIAQALRQLSQTGTNIFLMHGNRDFLIGENFAQKAGAKLISQPFLVTIYNASLLLSHGDSLCSKDIEYMKFRDLVRSPVWQEDFLSKPLAAREAFAEQARQQSKAMNSNKAEDIMDVTTEEVLALMSEHEVNTLIHGHTHRPAIHDMQLGGKAAQRIVLGDWDSKLWYLEFCQNENKTEQNEELKEEFIINSTLEPRLVLHGIDIHHEK